MLNFIYCDVSPQFDDASPNELLIVADKYDVPGLKRVCESEILKKVNAAAHALQLADDRYAPYLRQCSLEFISLNLER